MIKTILKIKKLTNDKNNFENQKIN